MNIPMKRCSNPECAKEFPATPEYFHRHKSSKDGMRGQCKVCTCKARQKYYWDDPERAHQQYLADHTKNKDRRNANSREKRRSGEWKIDREAAKKRTRRWEAENPERKRVNARATTARYKARKRNLPDTLTSTDWQHCLDYFNGCCAYCGSPPGLWTVIAADHFVPITSPDCPGTVSSNIVPACHARKGGKNECNNDKRDKPADQWLIAKFGERKAKQILKRIHAYFDSLTYQSGAETE